MRFENTPELFGVGIGNSRDSQINCEFCGSTHNKGINFENDDSFGMSICHTNFAGKQ